MYRSAIVRTSSRYIPLTITVTAIIPSASSPSSSSLPGIVIVTDPIVPRLHAYVYSTCLQGDSRCAHTRKKPAALSPRTRSARARARPTTCVRASGEPRAPLGAADPESNEVSAMNREETTRRGGSRRRVVDLLARPSRETTDGSERVARAGHTSGHACSIAIPVL